ANKNLELAIEDILFRSPGRPSRKPLVRYKSFQYQADSWTTPRRIVAKVEHHVGELFPRVGFIVTNLPLPNRAVVRFYNKRGTAEQWIKEGKQAAHWTRLSCHRCRPVDGRPLTGGSGESNEVRVDGCRGDALKWRRSQSVLGGKVCRRADFEGEKNATKYSRGYVGAEVHNRAIRDGQNGNPG